MDVADMYNLWPLPKEKKYKEKFKYKLERLTANAPVATVLGSIPASFGTVESEGRQMKQC
jgi:hypothetical protein